MGRDLGGVSWGRRKRLELMRERGEGGRSTLEQEEWAGLDV